MGLKIGNKEIQGYYKSDNQYARGEHGIMVGFHYVKKMVYNGQTVWNDENCPGVEEVSPRGSGVAWSDERGFVKVHPESKAWPKTGGTSDSFGMKYNYTTIVTYDNGDTRSIVNTGDGIAYCGKLYLNDVEQTITDPNNSWPTTTYTIPLNSDPHGKEWIVSRKDAQLYNTQSFIEYQTCDAHALFGVPTDSSIVPIDYGSAISSLSFAGNGYGMDAGVLVFRPLKSCIINFDTPTGWYIADTTVDNLSDFHFKLGANNPSLIQLPTEETGITGVYATAGFKELPTSMQLVPNSVVVIGTYGYTNFYFSKNFSVNTTLITLGGDATNRSFKITTDSDVNWTVATDVSWINLITTSGTGSGDVNFTASSYTGVSSGQYRVGHITVTDEEGNILKITIQQDPKTAYVTFGDAPGNIDIIYDNGTHATVSETDQYVATSDVFLTIPFTTSNRQVTITAVPVINGTYAGPCDAFMNGFAIATQNSAYESENAVPICNNSESIVKTLNGNTQYYLQIWRGLDTISDLKDGGFSVSIELTFS